MTDLVLKNARLVLANEVIDGSLVVRDGKIAEIASGPSAVGEDMGGDFVIPGLVELHTDHLEGHYAPRPRVRWNPIAAVLAHDAQVASAGITTVFDALRVGMDEDADMTAADMRKLADAIEDSVRKDRVRADHFIHLRCEVSAADCQESFRRFRRRRPGEAGVADGPRAGPAPVRRSRDLCLLLPAQAEAERRRVQGLLRQAHGRIRRAIRAPTATSSRRRAMPAASCWRATTTPP